MLATCINTTRVGKIYDVALLTAESLYTHNVKLFLCTVREAYDLPSKAMHGTLSVRPADSALNLELCMFDMHLFCTSVFRHFEVHRTTRCRLHNIFWGVEAADQMQILYMCVPYPNYWYLIAFVAIGNHRMRTTLLNCSVICGQRHRGQLAS